MRSLPRYVGSLRPKVREEETSDLHHSGDARRNSTVAATCTVAGDGVKLVAASTSTGPPK